MDAVERAAASARTPRRRASCTVRTRRGAHAGRLRLRDPDAELMFVGEAPGFHEDQQGVPFVGQAGKLLDRLLGGIGLTERTSIVANVIKCRPPGNRDPLPEEIAACEPHLFRQIELIRPKLVATLGNFATKLLSGRPAGITRVHGQEQEVTLGSRTVLALPALPPGCGALHAVDAEGARGGLRADPGAARARARRRPPAAAPEPVARRAASPRPSSSACSSLCVVLASSSAEETEALAARLAARLRLGDVVTISGELGTGKTTFVRGAAQSARRRRRR